MTHPTREDWMSYLYDELPAAARAELHTHLDRCENCREQLRTWQHATHEMSAWKLPRRRKPVTAPLIRWAAAAALVALAVMGGWRLVTLGDEVKKLRADVHNQVQRELESALAQVTDQASKSASAEAQSLIAAIAEKIDEKRLADQQTTLAALQQMNAQRIADYAKLRKELETVAVFSEAGLQRAANEISSLGYVSANFSDNK
jgi:hypothetical protein